MRCPKCQYISFDSPERCRNCGYEFALASHGDAETDLSLQREDTVGPPADFVLRRIDEPGVLGESPGSHHGRPGMSSAVGELPLFDGAPPHAAEGPPLVQPSPPPLAVRRPAAEVSRRTSPVHPPIDPSDLLAFPSEDEAIAKPPRARPPAGEIDVDPPPRAKPGQPAPWARRVAAALVDAAVLGGIDVVVLYFTMRLTGLPLEEANRLPLLPLVGFFVLLNGGYLVSFTTASGRTIGKMLTGIRVVGDGSVRVAFGQAVVRSAASVVSVVPFGAGLLLALFDQDRRTLHDRLSGTRVVRA